MLKQWLYGDKEGAEKKAAGGGAAGATKGGGKKPVASLKDAQLKKKDELDDTPDPVREETLEEKKEKRDAQIRAKLEEVVKEQPHQARGAGYDTLFRQVNRVLMEGHLGSSFEFHDGLQLSAARQFQNTQVTSKWQTGNPQNAHWEASVQMNGFSDIMAVTYNTMSRWQLMYQRTFLCGALAVGQFMMQPVPMAPTGMAGTFFGMIQYPWIRGGCSQFQYLRTQHIQFSHAQRLIRGLTAGCQLTYDVNTHGTTTSFAVATTSADKQQHWAFEVKPASGEWKLGTMRTLWNSDVEFGAMVETVEKKKGHVSQLVIGLMKPLIGGGAVHAVLSGFRVLKATIDLPLGLERAGINQLRVQYGVQYDTANGGLKHGMTLSA